MQVSVADIDMHLDKAAEIIDGGAFSSLNLQKTELFGKQTWLPREISEVLILRQIEDQLKRLTKLIYSDRNHIVRALKVSLQEGIKYSVLKLDIHQFYESLDRSIVLSSLEKDFGFPAQSYKLLSSFSQCLDRKNISGLPRGLSISAVLAEYAMRQFDQEMQNMESVRLYKRFVDDIVCFVPHRTNLDPELEAAKRHLVEPLQFSRKKSRSLVFSDQKNNIPLKERSFDFLGYNFHIGDIEKSNNRTFRSIRLTLAESKKRRIKKRISLSLLKYKHDNNFQDLFERIKIITGNYQFLDKNGKTKRYAGIRYNYPEIEVDCESINELDRFLNRSLFSGNENNRIRPVLNNYQRNKLSGLTFCNAHSKNVFFGFSASELGRLTSVWSYA